jgi:hypothetical protein
MTSEYNVVSQQRLEDRVKALETKYEVLFSTFLKKVANLEVSNQDLDTLLGRVAFLEGTRVANLENSNRDLKKELQKITAVPTGQHAVHNHTKKSTPESDSYWVPHPHWA